MNKNKDLTAKKISYSAIFVALIIVSTYITIPMPAVPFTLQEQTTMLSGMVLGPELGLVTVLVYIAIGLLGLPVFSGGSGGPSALLKPSFGYIIGFALSSYLIGKITFKVKKPSYKRLFWAGIVGLLIVYLFGTIYFYLINSIYLAKPIDFKALIKSCVLIFLPKDLVLNFLMAALAKRLIPLIRIDKI